jgi:hypothetical protein
MIFALRAKIRKENDIFHAIFMFFSFFLGQTDRDRRNRRVWGPRNSLDTVVLQKIDFCASRKNQDRKLVQKNDFCASRKVMYRNCYVSKMHMFICIHMNCMYRSCYVSKMLWYANHTMYVYTCTYIYIYMYVCIYMNCMYTYIYIYLHIYVCMYIYELHV